VLFTTTTTLISINPSTSYAEIIDPGHPTQRGGPVHALAQDPRRKAATTAALAAQLHFRVDPLLDADRVASRLLAAIPGGAAGRRSGRARQRRPSDPLDIVFCAILLYLVDMT